MSDTASGSVFLNSGYGFGPQFFLLEIPHLLNMAD